MASPLRSITTSNSRFGRSLFVSSTLHATLIGVGFAVPVLWSGARVSRPPATVWAAIERPPLEVFVEVSEPELEVDVVPLPPAEPEVFEVPIEQEPFPELPAPAPLEAVELLAEELRRPPLEPVFAIPEPEPAEDPEALTVADAESQPQPEPEALEEPVPETEPLEPAPVEVPPRLIAEHCPRPRYPARAQRLGWRGTVVCTFTVAADGSVRDVRVVESSGHALLDDAVLRTLREWRFLPGTRDDVPVEMELVRRFRFELPS